MSYDLRTPLTSIAGWAEASTDGTAPDPAAAGRHHPGRVGRLDRLVHDLPDLARPRARAFTLTGDPVICGTWLRARPRRCTTSRRRGGVVAVDLPAEPVTVDGDPDRLAQIAANPVENAGRHAGRAVRVAVAAEGGTAVLTVTDDGPGIPADEAGLGLGAPPHQRPAGGPARSRNRAGIGPRARAGPGHVEATWPWPRPTGVAPA